MRVTSGNNSNCLVLPYPIGSFYTYVQDIQRHYKIDSATINYPIRHCIDMRVVEEARNEDLCEEFSVSYAYTTWNLRHAGTGV